MAYGRDKGAAERAAAPALRVAFPTVSQLRLALTFTDVDRPSPSGQVHIMHPAARAHFKFPCPAAGCDGEYELSPIIDRLVRDAATRAEDSQDCRGVRAEHRATGKPCALHLSYKVDITY